jgi:competence protein ComEC
MAALAGDGAGTALRGLVGVVEAVSSLPAGHGAATPPGPVFWGAAGLGLAAAVQLARGGSPARAALPAGAAAALWVGGPVLLAAGQAGTLVCQLDVGQGDAAVIRSRGGRWLVLDAGPRSRVRDAGRSVVSRFLRDRGAGAVALLVLTHPDLDHVGGTDALLADFRVERVLDAANPVAREAYVRFLDGVAEEGAAWIPARPGARLRVDEVEVTVLGPAGPVRVGSLDPGTGDGPPGGPGDANEAGVSVRVRVGPRIVYVNTGDASMSRERAILERWPPDSLRTILLKVGHHGSRTSTAPEWLAATRPVVAVVSAGAGNRYGHPHPRTLRRLRAAGVPRIWRTDRDGSLCLHVRRDGHWRIRGEDGWRPPPGPGGARRRAPAHDTIPGGPRWRDRWSR